MPRKNTVTVAPYDHRGNLQHYPQDGWEYTGEVETRQWGGWCRGLGNDPSPVETYEHKVTRPVPPDWRPNKPFQATLRLNGMQRGRSAAYFTWVDQDGHTYPMFMSDMEEVVKVGTIILGEIKDTWIVRKRGQNYGIGLYR